MNGKTLTVLYDSGATHSFIYLDCVTKLLLPIFELPYDLILSALTNNLIRTSQVCMKLLF